MAPETIVDADKRAEAQALRGVMVMRQLERRVAPIRHHFETVRTGIAARLRGVCADMRGEEFDGLVRQMALIEITYAQRRDEQGLQDFSER